MTKSMIHWINKWKDKMELSQNPQSEKQKIKKRIHENSTLLKKAFANSSDVVISPISIGSNRQVKALIVYISGIVDMNQLDEHLLKPLHNKNISTNLNLIDIKNTINIANIKEISTFTSIFNEVSSGHSVLIIDSFSIALAIDLTKWQTRSVEEPSSETVIRGPKESFNESLQTNTSLLRKRIRTPKLKIKQIHSGSYSQTPIAISYIDGIADPCLVDEVMTRIKKISIDAIFDSGSIQEFIQDSKWSIFPTIFSTERPDTASAALFEGRVAIIVDGSPHTLILPSTFFMFFSSPDDYYSGFIIGTALRLLRIFYLMIAQFGPSIYVAITTFHQEMIPTTLLFSITQAREQVPFPSVFEAIIMEITFEALREASIRLPRPVGPAISIVGALVIGQAAIQASLVSPLMVIVVSITAIASFMIPHYEASNAIRILRFPIIVFASLCGLLGIIISFITILIHLCTLRSFGQPYMEPLAPFKKASWIDSLVRGPIWKMNQRPHLTGTTWNCKKSKQ
ncbi:spore germination protein [Sporolactobacillus sp. STCC-11]|uniref:spore germination protein n=1 Tax=Sporolactobacillus caesalpiniae TaxID=3230362 RepID=UPI0033967A62